MKKSNIFLTSALCLALCWSLLSGWFAASAINNYRNGKDPYYARTFQHYLESQKKRLPIPAKELCVSGNGTAVITILPGKELTVISEPWIMIGVSNDLKNGKSMITCENQRGDNDPVTITIPVISALSFDNCAKVTVRGLTRKDIHLHCQRVGSLTLDSCKAGSMTLDCPRTRDQLNICMDNTNQIDTLIASVKGSGKMILGTAGSKNQISLSDSMKIEASYDLMKKLANEPGSRVLKK